MLLLVCAAPAAFADGGDTGEQISELQQRVEQTAKDYDEASAKLEEINQRIKDNNAAIAKIKKELPARKARAAAAMEAMYKMQNQTSGLIDIIFSIDSLDDLIKTTDYLNTIQDRNVDAINDLNDAQTQLKEKSEQLASDKQAAEEEKAQAEQAAADAVAAREEAQREAEEQAKKEAAEAAAKKAAAQKQSSKKASSSSSSDNSEKSSSTSSSSSSSSQKSSNASEDSSTASSSSGTVSSGGVDWSVGKAKFVSIWTSRINNYLAGSPMAGQGATFANAAWDYGVDPRWSPAIAYTESSLGANCFKPYNAWGWGSSSWSSWSEAIYAHVAGLAHGYGTTISISAAQKYCPSNWQNWYNKTLAQMNSI